MDCAFCAQARSSSASDLALSRVSWPLFPLADVCERLADAQRTGVVQRCCLQVTAGTGYFPKALETVSRLRHSTSLPLSVAIYLSTLDQVDALFALGVDRIGLGLDAASERVFRQVKGAHWLSMVSLVEAAAHRYPWRISVHLVVGLGETEREMVERMLWARRLGAWVSLFAFTPVRGTALAQRPPPALDVYRRLQAARWMIFARRAGPDDFSFGEGGVLCDLALPERGAFGLDSNPIDGQAFCTSGCPGCNRPFYNERPGGPMYNYARPLSPEEVERACSEMSLAGTWPGNAGEE
jgi:biotin synthase